MDADDFVRAIFSGGGTYMLDEETGHTNDGKYPFNHSEDNAFRDCPGCQKNNWI